MREKEKMLVVFPKPPTTFLTCFSKVEKRKYVGRRILDRLKMKELAYNNFRHGKNVGKLFDTIERKIKTFREKETLLVKSTSFLW